MRRDVNFILFGLLLLLLIAMVALTIYAQYEYQSLNTDYLTAVEVLDKKSFLLDNKSAEINRTREELETKERILADLLKELTISEERELSLGGLFEGLKGEKELLTENLEKTTEERDGWQSNYSAAKSELDVCWKDYELKEKQLDSAEKKITSISVNVGYLESNINKSRGYTDDIENEVEDIDDNLSSLYQKVDEVEDENVRSELKDRIREVRDLITGLSDTITNLRNTLDNMEDNVKLMK